jgi:hypothetical protein
MTDQELRALVRNAIAMQLGRTQVSSEARASDSGSTRGRDLLLSYAQFGVPSGPDGSCIIEPSVMCNHCGYCKSYGH